MPNLITLGILLKRLQTSEAGIYFIVYGVSVLFAFLKTLYSAFVLIPEQMGWFVSLSLVAALMIYACNLGVMDSYLIRTRSIQRRGPSAALLRGQLYLVAIVMCGATTALISAYGVFYFPLQVQAPNLALAAAYLFLQPLQAVAFIDLQADRKLRKYSIYTLVKSAAPLIAIVIGRSLNPTYVDINFILICEVTISAILIGITVNSYRQSITLRPRLKLIFRLIRQGLFFTAQAMLNNLTSNLDKWFVITNFGFASAGAYSIPNQLILIGTTIAGMLTTYMIPTISVTEDTRSDVIKYYNTWSAVLAALVATLSIAVLYMFWEYITHYYSRYTLSFEIFATASVTMAFIGANFYEAYFRITDSGKQFFFIQAVSNLLLIILLILVYLLSLDLYWVALSVMLAKMFTWATCRIWASRHSKSK